MVFQEQFVANGSHFDTIRRLPCLDDEVDKEVEEEVAVDASFQQSQPIRGHHFTFQKWMVGWYADKCSSRRRRRRWTRDHWDRLGRHIQLTGVLM